MRCILAATRRFLDWLDNLLLVESEFLSLGPFYGSFSLLLRTMALLILLDYLMIYLTNSMRHAILIEDAVS